MAALAGLALAVAVALWLVAVGLACMVAAWYYTGGRRPYGYSGFGEVFVFVFFGLVATAGTSYVQTEELTCLGGGGGGAGWAFWPLRCWWPTTSGTSIKTGPRARGHWPYGWGRGGRAGSTPCLVADGLRGVAIDAFGRPSLGPADVGRPGLSRCRAAGLLPGPDIGGQSAAAQP